ncbi:MAG: YdcF family protein [Nitrospinales bacterium]
MVKILAKGLGALALSYLTAVMSQGFWLPPAAEFLMLRGPAPKADVIVVSTGSYARFRYAVGLAQKNPATKLLILGDPRITTPIPGKSPLDLAAQEALALGLPKRRLILEQSTSTLVDARVAKKIMAERSFTTAGVVSDSYNMRRLAMIFDHVFRGTAARLHYLPAEFKPDLPHPRQWWKYPREFKYVVMEWIKIPLDFFRIHFLLED